MDAEIITLHEKWIKLRPPMDAEIDILREK